MLGNTGTGSIVLTVVYNLEVKKKSRGFVRPENSAVTITSLKLPNRYFC